MHTVYTDGQRICRWYNGNKEEVVWEVREMRSWDYWERNMSARPQSNEVDSTLDSV